MGATIRVLEENPMPARTRERLAVEYLPIGSLRPDPRNPRQHSDRQIRQIARSIESFGFNVPILIDAENRILGGHGRVRACQHLGWSDVPVVRLSDLTDAQARAFSIADNRLTDTSTWDDKLLGVILGELASAELDFTLEATGFTMAEIDLRIEYPSNEHEPDPADELPNAAESSPVSKPGDIWLMGRHRVMCGDARDSRCYSALMEGEQAHLVFTDPPYNVPIGGHVSGKGAIQHREFVMAAGEMSSSQFTGFLATVFHLLSRHTVSGSIHFVCMDWRHQLEILRAGQEIYDELKNVCVWVKHNAGMGSLYRSQHEMVFVFKSGTGLHRNNVQLGQYGRSRTNVWNYPGVGNFGRQGEEGNLLALHPTVKPVALVADAILDCSARGDTVLDSFLGSGSVVIAAERVGRRCCGLELDARYVDTIARRWRAYSGEPAIHARSGKCFDEHEARADAY